MSNENKSKETADADVESMVLGLTHISGQPSHDAKEGEESAATVEGS